MASLLIKGKSQGRQIVGVTPEEAHWEYVGFQALRLQEGERFELVTEAKEVCLVLLSGFIKLTTGGKSFPQLGQRKSVFDGIPPVACYFPKNSQASLEALGPVEIALCSSKTDEESRQFRLFQPDDIKRSTRGVGSNSRTIFDILPEQEKCASHLLVVEVLTPNGHSSSYPPHKHDQDLFPQETRLEETYYHRLNPAQGFAFQRIYTDDKSLDQAYAVENHGLVMVPYGYHPVVAPYGYDLYYLNVMAGPIRHWAFHNDPLHAWLMPKP